MASDMTHRAGPTADATQSDERVMDAVGRHSVHQVAKQDHYHSVLSRMVTAVSQDHNQLRTLIYEFARRKLRKDLLRQFEDGDWSEIERQISTLESAINQVEADFAGVAPPSPSPPPALSFNGNEATSSPPLNPISQKDLVDDHGSETLPEFLSPRVRDVAQPAPIITVTEYRHAAAPGHFAANFWRTVQLVIAVLLGLGIYSTINGEAALYMLTFHHFGQPTTTSVPAATSPQNTVANNSPTPETKIRSGVTDLPLPTSYGVYAVVNGQLISLDTLPIRVPDSRVAISAMITTPSQAHVPDGQTQFIVYRRDLANDAPDRVSLRVVAQVMRALTFSDGGKPTYTNVDQSWVVRGTSYQMSVAPVADNPEMIVIRPDPPSLILPAGRYALVLKTGAFDFTVDGPMHDPAHCLERTETLGTSVYSECPKL